MRAELLQSVLAETCAAQPDVEGAAVLSIDGLVIAAVLPETVQEDPLGALTAALVSQARELASEAGRGEAEHVVLKAAEGYVLMARAGQEAVLVLLCRASALLGQLLVELRRTADRLERVL